MHPEREIIRRARRTTGLTQALLADRAGVSERTIRAVEGGSATAPRRDSLKRVCAALALSADDRAQVLIGWGYRPDDTAVSIHDMSDGSREAEILRGMLAATFEAYHSVAETRIVDFDPDGRLARETVEVVLVADRSEIRTYYTMYEGVGTPLDCLRLTCLDGADLVRSRLLPAHQIVVYEFALSRAMHAGEVRSVRYTIDYGMDSVPFRDGERGDSVVGCGFRRPPLLLALHLRFTGDLLPDDFDYVVRGRVGGDERGLGSVTPDAPGRVQLVLTEPCSGWHGLRWTWPDAATSPLG